MTERRINSVMRSAPMLGSVLFLFSAGFPPFDDATEVDLTLHMLQHVLIILSGVTIAYPLWGRAPFKESWGAAPRVSLLGCALLIVFWHVPVPWDTAVLNPGIHAFEHVSFLGVGLLAGSWLLSLSDSAKIGSLTAAFFGHMLYAVILISPWNVQVYALYSLSNQVLLGWVLLLTGPILVAGIAYVVARNPDWLGMAAGSTNPGTKRDTFLNRMHVPGWLAPALTAVLLFTAVGYFSITAYALSSQGEPPSTGAVVYIQETPISWQYSPQNLTVVLGANATVTWISHSISYDTVTGRETGPGPCGAGFSSCPIAPGKTFSYTFTEPGVYEYYCIYHPWMIGRVTVLG